MPNDTLHNARLIGAYHARKGWGDTKIYQTWYLSLSPADAAYIRFYILRGEWGRVDLPSTGMGPVATGIGMVEAVQRMAAAMQAIGVAARTAADQFAAGFNTIDWPGLSKLMDDWQRARLAARLESAFIPPGVARRLAEYWPAWALPDNLSSWWDNARSEIGDMMIDYWGRYAR